MERQILQGFVLTDPLCTPQLSTQILIHQIVKSTQTKELKAIPRARHLAARPPT